MARRMAHNEPTSSPIGGPVAKRARSGPTAKLNPSPSNGPVADQTQLGETARLASRPDYSYLRKSGHFDTMDPLTRKLRELISARGVSCVLCAAYDWGPIVMTHKMKYCQHRKESNEARRWLDMFKNYRAIGGGPGARCSSCRFPSKLCWRTVYKEEMDAKYGNEVEARDQHNEWYCEPRCSWVKVMQRFVAGKLVAKNVDGYGLSPAGYATLTEMEWADWDGLASDGPKQIQSWLEESTVFNGLRCPRLVQLFYLLAEWRDE